MRKDVAEQLAEERRALAVAGDADVMHRVEQDAAPGGPGSRELPHD
jgi:hypothetical protein